MLVWILQVGEHLPVQADLRKMRAGILTEALVERGHSVVWWGSTFSHQRKALLYKREADVMVSPSVRLRLLHAGTYRKNVSLRRYLHHRELGSRFVAIAPSAQPPDIVVASFPPIEFAREAVRYAAAHKIPVIIDVRDLWPDTFLEHSPRSLRPLARALLAGQFRRTREAMSGATSLVAISQGCLDWALRYAGRPQGALDDVYYTGYPDEPTAAGQASDPVTADLRLRRSGRSTVIFTFIGTFGRSYELQLVCETARRLAAEKRHDVHFALVGDGEQRRGIARAARALPNVSLLGWLTAAQIREVLMLTDVGLVPVRSVRGAMPNKAFEFMAAGVPILSSALGEMERLLASANAGRSYASGDVAALTRLVNELARDADLRQRMASNARELFRTRFRAALVYGAYAQHVERVAEQWNTAAAPLAYVEPVV